MVSILSIEIKECLREWPRGGQRGGRHRDTEPPQRAQGEAIIADAMGMGCPRWGSLLRGCAVLCGTVRYSVVRAGLGRLG